VLYDPDGKLEFAHTPYHTVVSTAGFAGPLDVATVVPAWLLGGTPAKVTLGVLPLLCELVGPAPNPDSPSTRYPHVLTASVVGEAAVPLDAVILLAPLVIALLVVLVVIVRLYPAVLSVSTEAVSLWTVHAPPGVGATLRVVDPPLVSVIVQAP
jgi:hypothetical protein